ncbi:hypothetical protein FB566_0359 [Stackebrandtia endophytica]|uniref:Uncharacterized protein n=1 Tax=Stackebrandtia endophytica TaxID=1496996 RepID=A0A543AQK8_9ACTN|nr:hypothetical protein FB566_0359 [Stackebrandtia endophytica]
MYCSVTQVLVSVCVNLPHADPAGEDSGGRALMALAVIFLSTTVIGAAKRRRPHRTRAVLKTTRLGRKTS